MWEGVPHGGVRKLPLRRYLDILENMEGRVQRYYYKREPRQLIPRLVPNEGLNSIVLSENRSGTDAVLSRQAEVCSPASAAGRQGQLLSDRKSNSLQPNMHERCWPVSELKSILAPPLQRGELFCLLFAGCANPSQTRRHWPSARPLTCRACLSMLPGRGGESWAPCSPQT